MKDNPPIAWIENRRARTVEKSAIVDEIFPAGIVRQTRTFHNRIPGYQVSPLKSLPRLAALLGLGGIWVKDESFRLSLNSFKVLGGSYAIYSFVKSELGVDELDIFSSDGRALIREKLGELTFAAATDGNHGRGVAWSASRLGFKSVIYVHDKTSLARIQAIESNGARVVVIKGTYDDAVRQVKEDAQLNGWQVISDTSWPGYEDVPRWVMQGYTTMFAEVQEQLAAQGIIKPSHVLVQAGVGSLAAATIGYYAQLFGAERPRSIVVEPDKAACLFHSAEIGDGEAYSFSGELDTIMAGLACGDPNPQAWRVLWDTADVFIKSPDYVAAKGMRVYGTPLAGDPFVISGESGASTLGALMFIMLLPECAPLRESLNLGRSSEVLLINSEGNTDPTYFRKVVWSGRHPVPEAYYTLGD
ncbi:MAG: diaminopropionate ammonia-lyase [Chloroflexi bacterium]|nr:diaminopropionate ammonia-lyase [Chloroflexota bacterium]